MKNIRLSKKAFFHVSLHRVFKGQDHGQGLLISCPALLMTPLLSNCLKRKIKEKISNLENNVTFSSNLRKSKFKEIESLSSYIKTYGQKGTRAPS